jgi:hypothetical protein
MKDLDGTIAIRWIARELGVDEDEALGAVMLHVSGIEEDGHVWDLLAVLNSEDGCHSEN